MLSKLITYVLFFSTVMVGVGIFTLGGEFEPDLTSYLLQFYYCSFRYPLFYHMYGTWFILFFLR